MSSLRERMNRLRGTGSAAGSGEEQQSRTSHASAEDAPSNLAQRAVPAGVEPGAADGQGLTERSPAAALDDVRLDCAMNEAAVNEPDSETLGPAWKALGVELASNEHGEFLLRRTVYPLDHRHGDHRLAELTESARALAAFHEGAGDVPDAGSLLFLDLETTGLGVGTGNVPFMTGIAYVEHDTFVVEQALIRHPAEERAMLVHVRGRVEGRPYLVTYNGRTFDWPVLAGRYIMNGLGRSMAEPKHLDFLHPSRSIWRNTLPSLKLSRVEEERLGIFRVDDVPGSMAPQLYFQFLSDGNPDPLIGVFRHNEWDMLSLACLAVRFGRLLSGGLGTYVPLPEESEELVRTGLWLERMGSGGEAEPLFERAAMREDAGSWCNMLAERDKRCGNWERAVLLWQKAADRAELQELSSGDAHIELSMYFEHKRKDYATALRYATAALDIAARRAALSRLDARKRSEADAIRKRIERLKKKAGRNYA